MKAISRAGTGPPFLAVVRNSNCVMVTLLVSVLLLLSISVSLLPGRAAASDDTQSSPIPMFAYYYIWFDPTSWNRAKTDYPVLGRYSSSDPEVMRQHIQWAKEAGIDGFIVSWKSTPKLNERLQLLIDLSVEEDFKLAIIYQGLDFERDPLPVDQVATDLDYFDFRWGDHEVFDSFEKPVVIWSGTWEFTVAEIGRVADQVGDRLMMLASERNLAGYERVSDLVQGNAYYWSSVNPETFPGYQEKLTEMGAAIHADMGLWIAPAAPGFDARLIGGSTIVERLNGETLRRQISVATNSAPDVIGVISWNEFSENSHIEPSSEHGSKYLEVLADLEGVEFNMIGDFDSSAPAATGASNGIPIIGLVAVLIAGSAAVVLWRETHRPKSEGLVESGEGESVNDDS